MCGVPIASPVHSKSERANRATPSARSVAPASARVAAQPGLRRGSTKTSGGGAPYRTPGAIGHSASPPRRADQDPVPGVPGRGGGEPDTARRELRRALSNRFGLAADASAASADPEHPAFPIRAHPLRPSTCRSPRPPYPSNRPDRLVSNTLLSAALLGGARGPTPDRRRT